MRILKAALANSVLRYEVAAEEQQFTMEKFKRNAKRLKDVKDGVSDFSRKVK